MSSLLVADSFLVADGLVRGLDLHRARYVSSCTSAGCSTAAGFWDEHVGRLPSFGRWFPRFELWSDPDGSLRPALQPRPAPTPGDRVRVSIHKGPDPRTNPRVKGPDLDALGVLKSEAAASVGADEVLLVDSDGIALEAAYSALAWWEDGVLCFPPADRPILPSVTAQLLRSLAATRDTETAERTRTPDELADADEVWLLNALHGIRPVHAWDAGPIDPVPLSRSTPWQQALTALAQPL